MAFTPDTHPLRGIPVDRKTITALLSIATSIQSHTSKLDLSKITRKE